MVYRPSGIVGPFVVAAFGNHVIANDRETGARRWTVRVGGLGEFRQFAVDDAQVVLVSVTKAVALDYTTGDVRWKASLPLRVSTLVLDRGLTFLGGESELAAYDREGKLLWHDKFDGLSEGDVALGVPGVTATIDRIGER